jgi:hypothetical protein
VKIELIGRKLRVRVMQKDLLVCLDCQRMRTARSGSRKTSERLSLGTESQKSCGFRYVDWVIPGSSVALKLRHGSIIMGVTDPMTPTRMNAR